MSVQVAYEFLLTGRSHVPSASDYPPKGVAACRFCRIVFNVLLRSAAFNPRAVRRFASAKLLPFSAATKFFANN